jgi:hypothetical protein
MSPAKGLPVVCNPSRSATYSKALLEIAGLFSFKFMLALQPKASRRNVDSATPQFIQPLAEMLGSLVCAELSWSSIDKSRMKACL